MSFFQKVANYLANEIMVKQLAKSRTFQRAALKTHEHVEGVQKVFADAVKTAEKKLEDVAKTAGETAAKQRNNDKIR